MTPVIDEPGPLAHTPPKPAEQEASMSTIPIIPGPQEGPDKPMSAAFWKNGKFERFTCFDCRVYAGETHTEISLLLDDERYHLFVVTDDPEIEAQVINQQGHPAAFDGFQLRANDGRVIEQITTRDNKAIH